MKTNQKIPCVCGAKRDKPYDNLCTKCRRAYLIKWRKRKKKESEEILGMSVVPYIG